MSILEIILSSYIGLMWVVVVLGAITPKGKFSNTMFMLLAILIPPIFIGIITDSIVKTIKRKKNKKIESEKEENE